MNQITERIHAIWPSGWPSGWPGGRLKGRPKGWPKGWQRGWHAGLVLGLALSLTLASMLQARATPPRSIVVEDVLVGVNLSHLFLLRTVTDNLETHGTALTDTVLVSKAMVTGKEDRVWPVRRVLETRDITSGPASKLVQDLPLRNQIDPYRILAEENAAPLSDRESKSLQDAVLQVWQDQHGTAIGRWVRSPEYQVDHPTLAAQLHGSFRSARQNVPAFQDGYDPLQHAGFDDPSHCIADRLFLASGPVSVSGAPRQSAFIRLQCFDPQEMVRSWLYVAAAPHRPDAN